MDPEVRHPGAEPARAGVLAAIHARVHLRFRITAGELADRVLSLEGLATATTESRNRLDRLVLDDLYLAMACAGGEDDAWSELQRKHFAFMRDFAARFVGAARAGELAADILGDLWQRGKIAQFEGRSTLRTWLGTVVAHAAINARSSVREHHVLTARDAAAVPERPSAVVDAVDDAATLARLVRTALVGLEDEAKLLLLLHYEQGLTLDDMTRVLGGSKATLSRRLKRVRATVRRAVEDLAAAEGASPDESLGRHVERARTEFDLSALLAPREKKSP